MHTRDMKDSADTERSRSDNVLAMILAAARDPDAPAVVCGERLLSYGALLDAARHNAERILAAGAGKGDFLLCGLDTGIELPVAWLATMFSDTVLVPVDLGWPMTRLAQVSEISASRILIVPADAASAPCGANLSRIAIDCDRTTSPGFGNVPELRGDDLIYGFFTSGSTGTPKCALNHHAGLANRFAYMTRRFGGGHRVYQNSAPLFDSSIWQLLWPLTSGGLCVLPSDRERWSLETVVDSIERHAITMTDFVPTLFKALVRSLEQGGVSADRLASLRFVLIGGEAIDPISVTSFRRLLPNVRIINTYGHTEASIGMIFHEVRDEDGDDIPLGSPIDNTHVRIVDEHLAEVPPGTFGEILVAGICVGSGYLNAPALTAAAFVPNPFGDLPGTVAYRSGDLGRIRGDGLVEFGGRIDDQVKVRGVRIELAELSMAAREAFPSIEDACPVVIAGPHDEQCIVLAYTGPETQPPQRFRQRLSAMLPANHLPQFFMRLPKMPVGPNGKTDRREVARQVARQFAQQPGEGEPSTPLGQVVRAFRQSLGAADAGEHTHFFEEGGDSLGAVHLSLVLQSKFGGQITAGMIYRHPTPARLLDALTGQTKAPTLTLPPVEFANPVPPRARSRRVLLTGATGFVGVHLLGRLLVDTDLEVSVLIRDTRDARGPERLIAAVGAAFPGLALPEKRVQLLYGDLCRRSLGLSPEVWNQLGDTIDEIVHCGADVNFLGDTASLFGANVFGTAELLRLCGQGVGKRFHQISTLAVRRIVGDAAADPVPFQAEPDRSSGYEYTKYLADHLVQQAQAQGLCARIYRLDDVLPSLSTGLPNTRSLIHLFLKTCLRYELFVRNSGTVGLLPVDAFAEWICGFVGGADRFSSLPDRLDVLAIRHVPFEELVEFVARATGRRLDPVDYTQFIARLSEDREEDALLLRSMLPPTDEGRPLFGESFAQESAGGGAVLAAPPWRKRFTIDLSDFAPFARYMERATEPALETQS